MPERVSVNEEEQLIQVYSFDQVTADDLIDALQTVQDFRRRTGFYRVLIDAQDQQKTPNLKEYKSFIESLPEDLVIAVIIRSWGTNRSVQHTAEAIAQWNRKQCKLFYSREAALSWLSDR